jgi:hypothetical protein
MAYLTEKKKTFIREDGSVQWFLGNHGTMTMVLLVVYSMYTSDITSRKNTEEQLRISETAFRGNFENAAIWRLSIPMAGG